jgi:hypothetical protein
MGSVEIGHRQTLNMPFQLHTALIKSDIAKVCVGYGVK